MPFLVFVSQHGALWKASAYYETKRQQTTVTSSWHPTRAEAVRELAALLET